MISACAINNPKEKNTKETKAVANVSVDNSAEGRNKKGIVYTESDLELYIQKWRIRDGLAGIVISDYFCEFLLAHTDLFFEIMEKHPDVFNQWLYDIENLSFVDFGGCLDRECLRINMIDAIELMQYDRLKETLGRKLLEKLQSINVRKIE